MTDTERFEAVAMYGLRVARLIFEPGWGVFDDAAQLLTDGPTPRAAVDDFILRLRADVEIDQPAVTE